jgi:catechol 2,3-dioxygenase-like lactoylglutathione lyase family enzyme
VPVASNGVQTGIVPRDLQASLRFYRDVLGFEYLGPLPVIEGRVLHRFAVDGGILKLLERGAAEPAPVAVSPTGPFQTATGIRWITIRVDDLDAYVERCREQTIQVGITEIRPGVRFVIVEDPDGNAVELVEHR